MAGTRPWFFVAPALLIYAIVIVYPLVFSVYLSFFRWDGISPSKVFVGLQNYITLFTGDPIFWVSLTNNAIWLIASLILPTGIGLILALVLNQRFRGSRIFRTLFYVPAVLSLAIVGLIWTWMYHPTLGLINQVFDLLGWKSLQLNWLGDPRVALYAVITAAAWNATGLPMLLYLAGLQTIPLELLEAAKVEGAGPIRRFFYVTFPLLRETTFIVLAITAINSLKAYDIVYAMTYGGPANRTQVLGSWMYFQTYNYNNVGEGTAIAVILFVLTLFFAVPYLRLMVRNQ
ncbi:MAG: sugar ABC transporter permease [Verrucomicrobia bacterium]|nr:sugar ABC transporter permease [Verrucomicrobiota bacterium]